MASCKKCGQEAVVHLPYDRSNWCAECFSDLFERRVARANREFKLIQNGDRVAVGVSGGKDSATLLTVTQKLAAKMRNVTVLPVLIDEGITGYRDAARQKAEELCEKLGFELRVYSFADLYGSTLDAVMLKRDEKRKALSEFTAHPSCSYCGVFRKGALNRAARELGATKLAVGHNADDVAQTVLMNMLRNEPERLKRFGPASEENEEETAGEAVVSLRDGAFVPRVKPLIYCLERECALYASLNQLPFHLGECPYASESFRGSVKDFLNVLEPKYPGMKFNTVNAFLSLKKDWSSTVKQKLVPVACAQCGEPSAEPTCKACGMLGELA